MIQLVLQKVMSPRKIETISIRPASNPAIVAHVFQLLESFHQEYRNDHACSFLKAAKRASLEDYHGTFRNRQRQTLLIELLTLQQGEIRCCGTPMYSSALCSSSAGSALFGLVHKIALCSVKCALALKRQVQKNKSIPRG